MKSDDADTQRTAIEFRHVSISFDEVKALSDVSFSLQPNEMLFITGASGSGKSVLLRLAMGMLQPDEGQIFVQGNEISALTEDEVLVIRSERMGLVFQSEALFTGMDVYDNAAYRLREHDWSTDKVDKAVREILGFVGLDKDLEKEVFELSGGMKRRLEMARAIVGWPPIMLFDEPTTGLDPINAQQVRDIVIRARDFHRMSSLYVSKTMHEITYLATRCALADGEDRINVMEADAAHLPKTRVMVLEEGGIVFLGGHQEFCESSLAQVLELTHPRTGIATSDVRTPDPWHRRYGSDDKLL